MTVFAKLKRAPPADHAPLFKNHWFRLNNLPVWVVSCSWSGAQRDWMKFTAWAKTFLLYILRKGRFSNKKWDFREFSLLHLINDLESGILKEGYSQNCKKWGQRDYIRVRWPTWAQSQKETLRAARSGSQSKTKQSNTTTTPRPGIKKKKTLRKDMRNRGVVGV